MLHEISFRYPELAVMNSRNNYIMPESFSIYIHCKYLNARFECNDIVIFIYNHYPLDPNAKCFTLSIRWFCIQIKSVMTVYECYNVIAFKYCIQKFTVWLIQILVSQMKVLENFLFMFYWNIFSKICGLEFEFVRTTVEILYSTEK